MQAQCHRHLNSAIRRLKFGVKLVKGANRCCVCRKRLLFENGNKHSLCRTIHLTEVNTEKVSVTNPIYLNYVLYFAHILLQIPS